MRILLGIIAGALAVLLCGYVLAVALGVAGCAVSDSGTGNILTTTP